MVVESFPEGVLILTFEEFKFSQKEFLQKLVNFVGISLPEIELRKSNTSKLGPVGMEFARFLNHIFRSFLNPAGLLPGIPLRLRGRMQIASPVLWIHEKWPGRGYNKKRGVIWETSNRILENVKQDNEILDKKYQLHLDKYGYY
jgi:hypothetical protein